ncbi:hypothetical protein [Lysinibacillus sp. G01H]|uniref:hypothetical protein n=1 Tax=Lysinibacillus sp. G01H TaxID=3026425 RepID=UPI00237D77C7|nr:hypothetical protein [Lysinibacillus sp. G01H]WDU81077.1 hypothetical protein PSR12_07905 [Lysinibacillus sp. G01H]
MSESTQQVKLLQWLAVALFFQLIYLNVFKYANLVQDILVYGAYLKSLSFYKEKAPIKTYMACALMITLMSTIFSFHLLFYWSTVLIQGIELLIIMEFGKILLCIEQKHDVQGTTTRVMKKYIAISFAVIISWTLLMNVISDWQMGLLFLGALLLLAVNLRLFLHVLALRKHVKSKSFVVTYLQK